MNDQNNPDREWRQFQWPLELSPEIIHIVRVRLDLPQEQILELMHGLSEEERIRAERFRFDEPRSRFVACRSTLREILGHCYGITPGAIVFGYGAHGKPEIVANTESPRPDVQFNISHSGVWGLIAVTIGAVVGVDIEEYDSRAELLRLSERFFAASEAAELTNLPATKQQAGFYRGWTSKEAYIKATGRGMSLPLSSFRVTIDPDRPASLISVMDQPNEPARWTVHSFDVAPNYAAAVMVAQPHCRVELWDWNRS